MKKYIDYIKEAEEKGVAIGHFNISNIEGLWGIFNSARERDLPVIIGVSEGERDFIGVKQVAVLVKSIREEYDYPIFLNADHTYSFERVKEVVDAGYDSVIIDGANLPIEENIEMTKKSVEYARSVNPEILIEAEIGYIGSSSKMLDELPEGVAVTEELVTKPNEAKEFVQKTGIDLLAPAVGTVHGMMKEGLNPKLHIERIKEIRDACGVPLVLHGGSGSSDSDVGEAIKAGISIVHVSTELRIAYKNALKKTLENNPNELSPYKYMDFPMQEIERVSREKLNLFNS